jgi:hypothetical protein
MARIRTLKPEFWQDEKLSPCDPLTRLVFLGLVSLADDAGRLVDNLRLIDAQIFPNTSDTAHEALMRLSGMGRIRRGITGSGQRIIEIVNWSRHQRIQHPNLKGALPEIVEEQALPVPHEPLMNDSRGAHEPLTHHTNDQRPVPTTSTSTNSAPRKRAAPGEGPKFPHFPMPLCLDMHALWVSKFGAVTVPVFRKEFGPLFTIAEADRPTTAPTNAELLAALKSYVDLAPMGDGATFATVRRAASVLSAIANARREYAEEPERRLDTVMRIIHGRPRLAA